MPDIPAGNEEIEKFHDFESVDNAMVQLGVRDEERVKIYEILAAILHLGNVSFEENNCLEGCKIASNTKNHLIHATKLLRIQQGTLEKYLLKRKIQVGSDPIL